MVAIKESRKMTPNGQISLDGYAHKMGDVMISFTDLSFRND
jgi:hypothetical protein